ncbi:MAG: adenosylcobalamin-dependent ribonucleoside-diphosphate reductase [Deltaproteobacteria bacterium]|nr:MAG: adenosylcobalamin-dependent ribonucleoside-diphosphate reductase [Deltaproteobacteria bacterium]
MGEISDPRGLSANAETVLEARYLRRDAVGRRVEDFEGLCQRVAVAVAEAESAWGGSPAAVAERFERMLTRREFLPNSPTLMNAGAENGQLAGCFVLPIGDSLEEIFEAVKRMAVIHQSGGGTGFSFSRLRPAGDSVKESHGVASGPVSFLEVFDAATGVIRQGGRRRGANMGVLRIDHPDVIEFIRAKVGTGRISNFNLSVGTTDAFWRAALAGESFDLINPRDGKVVDSVRASQLLDEIVDAAWCCGDPGVLFLDAIERGNPTPQRGPLESTNPCGELPLLPNESCNLGSIRLAALVREGRVDWDRLDAIVTLAVRFLDDVVEVSRAPYPEVAAATRANRKIGLGVMGFADLLVDVGLAYDSPGAVALAEELMARIQTVGHRASARLADERGVFPDFEGSRLAAQGLRLRNATVTSIAPTGTLSILADCSSGIEPYFALAYTRHVLDGAVLTETNPRFEAALRHAGVDDPAVLERIRASGSIRGLAGLPERLQRRFPISSDLPWTSHLDIQEAFQRHVDNAVSKTINLPSDASRQVVRDIYRSAWQRGLKGVTVFREGCRGEAVLVRGASDDCC